MSQPHIHPPRHVFSASAVRETLADSLLSIKQNDGLTYADMGRVMGKSGDRAEAWCNASADMPAFSLLAAWREWNGRFIGPVRDLVENSRPAVVCDRRAHSTILELALAMSVMLEDGKIDDAEIRQNRVALENVRDAVEAMLGRIAA